MTVGHYVPCSKTLEVVAYFVNYIRMDMNSFVNFPSRYIFTPTQRQWDDVKHIFHYLIGTLDMRLFYS